MPPATTRYTCFGNPLSIVAVAWLHAATLMSALPRQAAKLTGTRRGPSRYSVTGGQFGSGASAEVSNANQDFP